jgi:hypothetical protein
MIKHSNAELEVLKSFPNRGGKKILSSEVGATRKQCKFRVRLPQTPQISNWVASIVRIAETICLL